MMKRPIEMMKALGSRAAAALYLRRLSLAAMAFALGTGAIGLQRVDPAIAQSGWTMPWDKPKVRRAPRPRPQPREQDFISRGIGGASDICLQLEQKLVLEANRGSQSRDQLPQINEEIRKLAREYSDAKRQLNRGKCFETFLFVKTLRQSRKCRRLARRSEDAKARLRKMKAERQQMQGGSRDNSYQDEIISALARNRCGANYQQEARRRSRRSNPFSSSFWQDNDGGEVAPQSRFGALPFATYRTLCVRLCDGYYFPVSFSTLPNHFQRDADICQSKCAAPVDLYYHQNPGGSVEQMTSATQQTPYTQLPAAWRYRKEYVQGCSCKQAEYNPVSADSGQSPDSGGFRTTIKEPFIRR